MLSATTVSKAVISVRSLPDHLPFTFSTMQAVMMARLGKVNSMYISVSANGPAI